MSEENATQAADVARDYYNTRDVDGFYARIWGGEDIHTGIYDHHREAVGLASRRTVERIADLVADDLGPGRSLLDLGAGYGGAARYLARRFGCRITALNISRLQNERHRALNAEQGFAGLIEVVTGSFDDIPAADGQFDVVWSQEALCHSGDRALTLGEAVRVLAPGGRLVFTDLMAAEGARPAALRPLCDRLRVKDLATAGFYRERLTGLGLTEVRFEDLGAHLPVHYRRLTEELELTGPELTGVISEEYLNSLRENLPLWAKACDDGLLSWGIFHARKP
ncbi:SAM-dependent methyltransferase [Streptomyces orinoci]|uniref:Methyltransferase domain-containing protein n=1 Tax=Streptomyces orinoci TaxID=67339 RepID=A0ABV3K3H6_STRON|nr:methyltransferase domain-containing protein [Streptomyces orinoci]